MPRVILTTLFPDFIPTFRTRASLVGEYTKLIQPTDFVSVYFQDEDGGTFADSHLPSMMRASPTIRVMRQSEVDDFDRRTSGIRLLYGEVIELEIEGSPLDGEGVQSITQISDAVKDWQGIGVVALR